MSILFATPAYAHQMYIGCVQSYLALVRELLEGGIPHAFLFTGNESLITRARNTAAARFLELDYEMLFFIDADIEFKPEDVRKLWNLDADVAVGAYPMKKAGSPPVSAWVNGRLVNLDELDGPTPVDYAGTGFMGIKRRVLEKMREVYPQIAHKEGLPQGDQESRRDCWAFFDCEVYDETYLSEDYNFARRVREMGMRVVVDPSIRLKHWGVKAFV